MSRHHHFCHPAMATEFEIVFSDPEMDAKEARGVSALVFREIDRMEEELSRFKPSSDVWRINGLRSGESVTVDFATIDCLMLAKAVHEATGGAFDVTSGPLMRCWRNPDGSPRAPNESEVRSAMERVGMGLIEVDAPNTKVTVRVDFPTIDLGALGKGYALDQAVRILEEHEVSGALLNAGASTLLAWGQTPHPDGWPIDLDLPEPRLIGIRESCISCSGFDVKGEHIMDPRTGHPVKLGDRRWYIQAPTAALSDALSTAFVVMNEAERTALLQKFPEVKHHT